MMENKNSHDNEFDYQFLDVEPEEDLYFSNKYKDALSNIYLQTNKAYEEDAISHTWDEAEERFKIDKRVVETFINNIVTDVTIKRVYAYVLLILLFLQLVAVNVIFILKGAEILRYSDKTFNIFIAGALIEVIALVAIIIRYLFKDNISESLKNILEKNKHK